MKNHHHMLKLEKIIKWKDIPIEEMPRQILILKVKDLIKEREKHMTYNKQQIVEMMEARIEELEEWLENPLDVPDTDGLIQAERDWLYQVLEMKMLKEMVEENDRLEQALSSFVKKT